MRKITIVTMLCLIILLVMLSGCKKNLTNYGSVRLNNKVSFLVPAGMAKYSESSYSSDSIFRNEYHNKELIFTCVYFTNSCPSSTLDTFVYNPLRSSHYKKSEREINGKKAVILKIKVDDGFLDYEYWRSKVLNKYYKLSFNDYTLVYFLDIDNQKTNLMLEFESDENYNDIVDNIIDSVKFLKQE